MIPKASPSLRVQTLFLHPFLGRRGSDYLYYKKLKELERVFPLKLRLCDAPLPVLLGNILHAADALWGRLARRFGLAMPGWWSSLRRLTIIPQTEIGSQTDLVFTNFLIPVNRITAPIILESDFLIYGTKNEQKLLRQWLHVPAWFIHRARLVVVRHELSRAAFAASYPQDAEKAVIVPHYLPWVEPVLEERVLRKFRQFGDSEIYLLFVGNDARRKGLPNLLKAYSRLRQAGRRIRLTVISEFRDGPIALPPDTIVRSRLSPHEVYALMADAHIFAMPTRREAVGLVFLEAMANGCALLVPDTSPQREIFGDYGLRVPPDDTQAITAALERFLDDGEFTFSCALRARRAFVEQFHHSVVGKQYWDLFRRAVVHISQ
jgi:glycosyltransferase involved in cell wall biosynthesis